MIGLPSGTRVWIVAGHTDMRKGFDGLAALVQTALAENPFCGHVFVFRGRRGDILKLLWFDGQRPDAAGQAIGTRPLRLAAGDIGQRVADGGAVVDAARRHRLAHAGAYTSARTGGLNHCIELPPVQHRWRAPI